MASPAFDRSCTLRYHQSQRNSTQHSHSLSSKMKSTITAIVSFLALRPAYALPTNQTGLAERTSGYWQIFFFADGCPSGKPSADDEIYALASTQTEYCDPTPAAAQGSIHNVYLEGIAGVYTVTLFGNEVCSGDVIATFSGDGCYVVPANAGIETVDVVAIN